MGWLKQGWPVARSDSDLQSSVRTELLRAVAAVLTGLALLFVLTNNTALLFHILQSFSPY